MMQSFVLTRRLLRCTLRESAYSIVKTKAIQEFLLLSLQSSFLDDNEYCSRHSHSSQSLLKFSHDCRICLTWLTRKTNTLNIISRWRDLTDRNMNEEIDNVHQALAAFSELDVEERKAVNPISLLSLDGRRTTQLKSSINRADFHPITICIVSVNRLHRGRSSIVSLDKLEYLNLFSSEVDRQVRQDERKEKGECDNSWTLLLHWSSKTIASRCSVNG